jgi:RNA polymerase sigma factor (sigma-70 family)
MRASPYRIKPAGRKPQAFSCHMISTTKPHISVLAPTLGGSTIGAPARPSREQPLERHHADAFAWALSCCRRDRAEAEDVLQTSYLKVLDGRAAFLGRSSYKTWLFGVIRRTASEHRRGRLLRRLWSARSLDTLQIVDATPGPATQLVRSESTQRLERALARLSRRQRDLLHLVFYQELTIREAAEVLGVSIGTARTHYERGKARLREQLRDHGDEVAGR